jgi:hypothetical protein
METKEHQMKKYFAIAIVFAFILGITSKTHAAIQMPVAWSTNGPNMTGETDSYAGVTSLQIDIINNTLTVNFAYGAATTAAGKTTAFTPSTVAPTLNVTFYPTASNAHPAGTWCSSIGQQGTLTAGQITAIQNIINSATAVIRDPAESFVFSAGVFGIGGTNYPW